MNSGNSGLFVTAIVAVVAITGIVMMLLAVANDSRTAGGGLSANEANSMAGKALYRSFITGKDARLISRSRIDSSTKINSTKISPTEISQSPTMNSGNSGLFVTAIEISPSPTKIDSTKINSANNR
ncbi:hypothetical protein HY772_03685 [Candidatus Woesearchaeota archaeon]|nr:hypothetical protein [Candidatus Woesearchaeota archaeon]